MRKSTILFLQYNVFSPLLFIAPCRVGIDRGRILYNGRKLWIADLTPNRVLHKELVSVYCKDKARNCGYAVPTQCIDGKLKIPQCFEGKDYFKKIAHYLYSLIFTLSL